MAITPNEARVHADPKSDEIKRLEALLDAAIIDSLRQSGSKIARVDASIFPSISSYGSILSLYRDAGWDVSYSYGAGSDPDHLVFRPKPPLKECSHPAYDDRTLCRR